MDLFGLSGHARFADLGYFSILHQGLHGDLSVRRVRDFVWFPRIQEFLGFVTMPFVSLPGECPDPHGEQRLQVAYR